MTELNPIAIEHVVACGRRILRGARPEAPEAGVWGDPVTSAVERALLDRADGDPAIEAEIKSAKAAWSGAEAFSAWLDRLGTRKRTEDLQ